MRIRSNNYLCRNKVDYLLKSKGISRGKLAELLKKKEVRTVYSWFQKKNQHPIMKKDAEKIADLLGVRFDDIVGSDGESSFSDDYIRNVTSEIDRSAWTSFTLKTLLKEQGCLLPYEDEDDLRNQMYIDLFLKQILLVHEKNMDMLLLVGQTPDLQEYKNIWK